MPNRHSLAILLWAAGAVVACRKEPAPPRAGSVSAPPNAAPLTVVAAPAPLACPANMALLPGGSFWIGSDPEDHYSDDESPRFRTTLPPFCVDRTEVTVAAYAACVARGACTPALASHSHCNAAHQDRPEYPINCVTWPQADAFCTARGVRLPSEAEWEYAARGGDQALKYPWGEESPDGHACWKHGGGSCATREFPPGAFGLFDISGNVWEWTEDWYGPYPWPPETGSAKVYRGGSWSRRFEKWMHTRLRNRSKPGDQGSHLGFRCATVPDVTRCAYGKVDAQRCLPGVDQVDCAPRTRWNGARCAKADAPRCTEGRVERPGRGCVLVVADDPKADDLESLAAAVERAPAPEFEADCHANFTPRVHAFRYFGGTHAARNLVSGRAGCKNRDVGVGWNSTCCP